MNWWSLILFSCLIDLLPKQFFKAFLLSETFIYCEIFLIQIWNLFEILCLKAFWKRDLSTVHINNGCVDCYATKKYLLRSEKVISKAWISNSGWKAWNNSTEWYQSFFIQPFCFREIWLFSNFKELGHYFKHHLMTWSFHMLSEASGSQNWVCDFTFLSLFNGIYWN